MDSEMNNRDRDQLGLVVRKREKLAKADAKQRSAELLAKFEEQLATINRQDDERWSAITEQAEKAVAAADAEIARICQESGMPERFRPGLSLGWYGRGENASRERRTELRRVATTRIAAMEREACVAIERRSLQIQTALVAGGLTSGAAHAFLASMPAAEDLMPALDVADVEKVIALPGEGDDGGIRTMDARYGE